MNTRYAGRKQRLRFLQYLRALGVAVSESYDNPQAFTFDHLLCRIGRARASFDCDGIRSWCYLEVDAPVSFINENTIEAVEDTRPAFFLTTRGRPFAGPLRALEDLAEWVAQHQEAALAHELAEDLQ